MTADSTLPEREAGDAEVAAVLAEWLCREKHRGTKGGYCANCLSRAAVIGMPTLAPLIAERERAAKAEALREAARDWQVSLWPLGVVSWLRRRMTTHAHRTHDRHEPEGDL